MVELLFHNVYLRGIGIPVLVEMVLVLLIIRNRKPGASRLAASLTDPNSLTDRGLRLKRLCDIASAVVAVWFIAALVLKLVVPA